MAVSTYKRLKQLFSFSTKKVKIIFIYDKKTDSVVIIKNKSLRTSRLRIKLLPQFILRSYELIATSYRAGYLNIGYKNISLIIIDYLIIYYHEK